MRSRARSPTRWATRSVYFSSFNLRRKLWRFKYRLHGKEKKLSIGAYPEISLGEARAARDAARKIIAHGGGPCHER
ncbi:MAG TPA: Arm DNA-binding domain-containing protein [Sphingomonadaceae bacterium]|nr:Arm DNA-binding domain-containing protein [Sphingomonadaceae bacterium]